MATYLFKCPECGEQTEWTHHANPGVCAGDGTPLVRDWKGEAVGFTTVPGGYKEANRA